MEYIVHDILIIYESVSCKMRGIFAKLEWIDCVVWVKLAFEIPKLFVGVAFRQYDENTV